MQLGYLSDGDVNKMTPKAVAKGGKVAPVVKPAPVQKWPAGRSYIHDRDFLDARKYIYGVALKNAPKK